MTTKEIQNAICKYEILKSNIPCQNVSFLFAYEIDVLAYNGRFLSEYEVKTSRGDFKRDIKKQKWQYFDSKVESQIPNYFYYACPTGLISIEEVQAFAGLIYVNETGEVTVIKKAKLLHKAEKDKNQVLTKLTTVLSQRAYLGSCLTTYQNNINKEHRKRWEEQKKENTRKFLEFIEREKLKQASMTDNQKEE